jgi:hypothetical protein
MVSDYIDYDPWIDQFPATSAVIYPLTGGVVYGADGNTTITFPVGAVSEPTIVTYADALVSDPPPPFTSTGHSFTLEGQTVTGDPIEQILLPMTIVIHYSETGIDDETALVLFVWENTHWSQITTSVDPEEDTATAMTDKLGLFALFGQGQQHIYLPVILR